VITQRKGGSLFLSDDDHAHLSYLFWRYIWHPHRQSICSTHICLKFESYNLQSKNLVHNFRCWFLCPKCSKIHLCASLIQNFFLEVIPPDPVKTGRGEWRVGLRHASWLLGRMDALAYYGRQPRRSVMLSTHLILHNSWTKLQAVPKRLHQ